MNEWAACYAGHGMPLQVNMVEERIMHKHGLRELVDKARRTALCEKAEQGGVIWILGLFS